MELTKALPVCCVQMSFASNPFPLNPRAAAFSPAAPSAPVPSPTEAEPASGAVSRHKQHKGNRKSAAAMYRNEVSNQCTKFKRQRVPKGAISFECPACKRQVRGEWARCDHHPVKLKALWEQFEAQDEQDDWQAFHREHATLRVVCKDCEKESGK